MINLQIVNDFDNKLKLSNDLIKEVISDIIFNDGDNSYNIFICKEDAVLPWKKFNSNMAISVEYNLEY